MGWDVPLGMTGSAAEQCFSVLLLLASGVTVSFWGITPTHEPVFGEAHAVQSNFPSQKPATDRWKCKIFKIKALQGKHTRYIVFFPVYARISHYDQIFSKLPTHDFDKISKQQITIMTRLYKSIFAEITIIHLIHFITFFNLHSLCPATDLAQRIYTEGPNTKNKTKHITAKSLYK